MVNHVPLFFSRAMCQYASGALLPPGDAEKTLKAALRSTTTGAMTTTLARQRPRSYAALTERGSTPSFMRTGRDGFEMFES